jgi:hypothetical protein
MAGALLGASSTVTPEAFIQDQEYIEGESERLYKISQHKRTESFSYPDLMAWKPPKSQVETVIETRNGFEISGLGRAKSIGKEYSLRGNPEYIFQWMGLSFGQTVLTKRRSVGQAAKDIKLPAKPLSAPNVTEVGREGQAPLFSSERSSGARTNRAALLDEKTSEAIRSGFSAGVVGQHILELASMPEGIELAIGYVAIIAKARKAREMNSKNRI